MSIKEENVEGGVSQETKEIIDSEPTEIEIGAPGQSEGIDEPKDDDDEPNETEQAPKEEDGVPILEPHENDILNGRGASVNAHRYGMTLALHWKQCPFVCSIPFYNPFH